MTDNRNDYPKFGIWPDGLYMSATCFCPFGGRFFIQELTRVAFNKARCTQGLRRAQSYRSTLLAAFRYQSEPFAFCRPAPAARAPNLFISTQRSSMR